jgi:hypothetical protein
MEEEKGEIYNDDECKVDEEDGVEKDGTPMIKEERKRNSSGY